MSNMENCHVTTEKNCMKIRDYENLRYLTSQSKSISYNLDQDKMITSDKS